MSDILCVTNRRLCGEDFILRIEKIAAARPQGIILREKDISADEYGRLAEKVIRICDKYGTQCILHSFTDVAMNLGHTAIHLPLHILRATSESDRKFFKILGASCHSAEDAIEAERLGCTYITAGHVFETDCKKGLKGRGPEFIREVSSRVSIPVYAIGGISAENISDVRGAGAKGACVMSGIMTCEDVAEYLGKLR
ncbi:MAG: thiamine phosphate synthase [Candidatus Coproplasma sp.]